MTDETEDEINAIVQFVMASGEHARIKSYTDAGRVYSDLSDDRLRVLFVEAFEDWSYKVTDSVARRLSDDLTAEFGLRGMEPPLDLVPDAVERVTATVAKIVQAQDADWYEETNADMLREYKEAKGKQN